MLPTLWYWTIKQLTLRSWQKTSVNNAHHSRLMSSKWLLWYPRYLLISENNCAHVNSARHTKNATNSKNFEDTRILCVSYQFLYRFSFVHGMIARIPALAKNNPCVSAVWAHFGSSWQAHARAFCESRTPQMTWTWEMLDGFQSVSRSWAREISVLNFLETKYSTNRA